MSHHRVTAARGATLALTAAALAGCPSSGVYSSPRLLPPGAVQHAVIVETFGVNRGHSLRAIEGGGVMPLPAVLYSFRLGLRERVELGGRVGLGALGADAKFGLLRSRWVDLALDPSVGVVFGRNQGETYPGLVLGLPLVAGFNVSQRFQIILGGRFALGVPLRGEAGRYNQSLNAGYGGDALIDAIQLSYGGVAVGGLAGLRIALGDGVRGVALQPAYDLTAGIAGDGFVLHSFGLGVTFGAQPPFAPVP